MMQLLHTVFLVLALVAGTTEVRTQDWDIAGRQEKAGLAVYSGLGEPLAIRAVAMEDGVFKGVVAMRILLGTEMLRFHMGAELEPFHQVLLPECVDTARVVILTGTSFESEFFEVDTVLLELSPTPVRLTASEARVDSVPGQPRLIVQGLRQIRSSAPTAGSTSMEFSLDNVRLRDASNAPLRLSVEGEPEQTSQGGRFWDYKLTLKITREDGRPLMGRTKGSFDVVFGGIRVVCGRRSASRTMRASLALP